jgi:leucyl-tRNA synthetase
MSKSKGNVVSPDELIREYGADTLRLYTLFIGPPEKDVEWSDQGIEGAARFLRRLWRRVYENQDLLRECAGQTCKLADMGPTERDLYRKLHATIRKVTEDVEGAFHFNSAIAQIMELSNAMDAAGITAASTPPARIVFRECVETMVRLLAPFAPHIAEELWCELGHAPSLLDSDWPAWNEEALACDAVEVVIQVNGKVRGRVRMPAGLPEPDVRARALADEAIAKLIEGKTVRKVVVVPDKLVSIAVG